MKILDKFRSAHPNIPSPEERDELTRELADEQLQDEELRMHEEQLKIFDYAIRKELMEQLETAEGG